MNNDLVWHKLQDARQLPEIEAILAATHYDIWSRPGKIDRNNRYPIIVGLKQAVPPFKANVAFVCDDADLMEQLLVLLKRNVGPAGAVKTTTAAEIHKVWGELEATGHYAKDAVVDEVCAKLGITFQQCSDILSAAHTAQAEGNTYDGEKLVVQVVGPVELVFADGRRMLVSTDASVKFA